MNKYRQTVIDRAIAQNRKITDSDVESSADLRSVGLDFIQSYTGGNSFMKDLASKYFRSLSCRQIRAALNVMIDEYKLAQRIEAESKIEYTAPTQPYMDIRTSKQKARDDAGVKSDESTNTVDPLIPNGIYTVLLGGGDYRTIKITDAPEKYKRAKGTQIASYLAGSDNESNYIGFGFLARGVFSLWSKHQGTDKAQALQIAMSRLLSAPMDAAMAYVLRSGKCFVCNRTLTTPESIQAGIGPRCAEKIGSMGFIFGAKQEAPEKTITEPMTPEQKRLAVSEAADLFS